MPLDLLVYGEKVATLDLVTPPARCANVRASIFLRPEIADAVNKVLFRHYSTKDIFESLDKRPSGRTRFALFTPGGTQLDCESSDGPPYGLSTQPDTTVDYGQVMLVPLKGFKPVLRRATPIMRTMPIKLHYCDTIIELPAAINCATTVKQLHTFLDDHPKIRKEIIAAITTDRRYHFALKLYQTSKTLKLDDWEQDKKVRRDEVNRLSFKFCDFQSGAVLRDDDYLTSSPVTVLPILPTLPKVYDISIPVLKEIWFNANRITMDVVCQAYLGALPERTNTEDGPWYEYLNSMTVEQFCHEMSRFWSQTRDNHYTEAMATVVAYYCRDTGQTELFSKYYNFTRYVLIPLDPQEIYKLQLPATKSNKKTSDSTLQEVTAKVLEGHSSKLPWSFARSTTHDEKLSHLHARLELQAAYSDNGSSMIANLLLCAIKDAEPKKGIVGQISSPSKKLPRLNYTGRFVTTISQAVALTHSLPADIRYRYHHEMFFAQSERAIKTATILGKLGVIPDVVNLITQYMQYNYFEQSLAIPPAMLTQIATQAYKDKTINNSNIITSVAILLQELGISPKTAHGILVGPDRPDDLLTDNSWSLADQINHKLKNITQRYIYFALPTRGAGATAHAVMVVIVNLDIAKEIYVIDSQHNQYGALNQALAHVTQLITRLPQFKDYIIKHPPEESLHQQLNNNLCGAYVVSNIISIITTFEAALNHIDLSPHRLGIQLSKLLKNSQINLELWVQSPAFKIDIWKNLIIMTTLTHDQIAQGFLRATAHNHQAAMGMIPSNP